MGLVILCSAHKLLLCVTDTKLSIGTAGMEHEILSIKD